MGRRIIVREKLVKEVVIKKEETVREEVIKKQVIKNNVIKINIAPIPKRTICGLISSDNYKVETIRREDVLSVSPFPDGCIVQTSRKKFKIYNRYHDKNIVTMPSGESVYVNSAVSVLGMFEF